jgi:hypothetical protein
MPIGLPSMRENADENKRRILGLLLSKLFGKLQHNGMECCGRTPCKSIVNKKLSSIESVARKYRKIAVCDKKPMSLLKINIISNGNVIKNTQLQRKGGYNAADVPA